MKISKRRLTAIIKEEKAKLISEQPISGEQAEQMQAAQVAAQDVKTQAGLMADLDDIATAIEEIAAGMYGMSGPGTVSGDAGDEMAQDLELQTQRLTDLHQKMENYFIAITG